MDNKLNNFIEWMKNQKFFISSKVLIVNNPFSNYGLIATDSIETDEIIFKVPRKSLLSIENSALYNKLINDELIKNSKWASLILCILHEAFLGENSQWNCYLNLFPNFENLKLPLFWKNEDKELLEHTSLENVIERDNESIYKDFNEIVMPFVCKYPNMFHNNINIDIYKFYVSFVMAYSFTEHSENDEDEDEEEEEKDLIPYMVPMADVLNHKSFNNAHLMFEKEELVMVSTKRIEKGEEVLNTYGDLSNCQLLQMYGFTLSYDENKDDVVELNLSDLTSSECNEQIISNIKKIDEFCPDLLTVLVGKNGFANTQELALVLSALNMQDKDFKGWCNEMKSGDQWEEENEDVELMADNLDSFETAKKIPLKSRNLLHAVVCKEMKTKSKALANVNDHQSNVPCPKLFVQKLLSSHVQILENAMRVLS